MRGGVLYATYNTKFMKAVVYYKPMDLRIEEVPTPKPKPGEILMRNISALTCGTDVKQYKRGYPRFKEGQILIFGHESAGIVEEVGEGVTKFKKGDRIAPHNSAPCNKCYFCKIGEHSMCEDLTMVKSGWAEFRLLPAPIVEQNTFLIPENISFRSAALLEPLGSAVHCIDNAGINLSDTVVIHGAGPLGLMQVKLAKMRGAYVISTDVNAKRLETSKALGADEIIDASKIDDIVKAVRDITPNSRGVDIAIDATGLAEIWEKNLYMVRKGGTVMEFGGLKAGSSITVDSTLLHYSMVNIKGVFHTKPRLVQQSFDLIKRGEISEDLFVQGTYSLDKTLEALDSHARGEVIKNEIRCDRWDSDIKELPKASGEVENEFRKS